MRYIDISNLVVSDNWKDRAQRALEKAQAEVDPVERIKVINRNSLLWRELKDALADLSHDKCWYCEAKQERSDDAVDHFRPKARVQEQSNHEGYWWLAFYWKNYRYSCTYCNSHRKGKGTIGGKHDHFPLLDETQRVCQCPDNLENIDELLDQERPILLDPTKRNDPMLIFFASTGEALPQPQEAKEPIKHRRAVKSIELYHLNHENIVEIRKKIYNEVSRKIRQGDKLWKRSDDDPDFRANLESLFKDLDELAVMAAPYSLVARNYLHDHLYDGHTERYWIKKYLMFL